MVRTVLLCLLFFKHLSQTEMLKKLSNRLEIKVVGIKINHMFKISGQFID